MCLQGQRILPSTSISLFIYFFQISPSFRFFQICKLLSLKDFASNTLKQEEGQTGAGCVIPRQNHSPTTDRTFVCQLSSYSPFLCNSNSNGTEFNDLINYCEANNFKIKYLRDKLEDFMNSGDPYKKHILIRRVGGRRDFGKSDFTLKMFAINWLKESICRRVDLDQSGDILNYRFTMFYLAKERVIYKLFLFCYSDMFCRPLLGSFTLSIWLFLY